MEPPISGFPKLDADFMDAATRPMGLHEIPEPAQYERAIALLTRQHPRIAATITSIWGHKECGDYISNLMLSGGDGAGNHRVGFSDAASNALFSLNALHDRKFTASDATKVNPFGLNKGPRR